MSVFENNLYRLPRHRGVIETEPQTAVAKRTPLQAPGCRLTTTEEGAYASYTRSEAFGAVEGIILREI